jgi:hypothetical protein
MRSLKPGEASLAEPLAITEGFISNPAQQKQDDENGQKHTQSAGRTISPIPAVWPGGECADQHQNEQNYQDSS